MNAFDYDVDDDESLPVNEAKNALNSKNFSGKKMKLTDKSADDESSAKSTRKPRPKLDFNRLLNGRKGLGYLALFARKNLKLSGKSGAEASDLSQISVFLQEWAKQVFPKMPLIDLLLKVEDICQGRVMKACMPQILVKLQEMGEEANVNDLEVVESEVKTRLATSEAERAIEKLAGVENGSETTSQKTSKKSSNSLDFDLDDALAQKHRIERADYSGSEIESEDAEDSELAEELEGFINDRSESDSEEIKAESSESDAENEISSEDEKEAAPKLKGQLAFDFNDESDENETVKKRKISSAVIMDSSDSE